MMKKLLIAATLTAAALGATSLLADTGHQRGQHQANATENCPMAGEQGARTERRAEMQKQMQEMHARMGSHEGRGEGRGQGRGMQGGHQH